MRRLEKTTCTSGILKMYYRNNPEQLLRVRNPLKERFDEILQYFYESGSGEPGEAGKLYLTYRWNI